MRTLSEALIGKHNINNTSITNDYRCVYITPNNVWSEKECVWVMISAEEARERLNSGELENDTLGSLLNDNRIEAFWILPCDTSSYKNIGSRSVFARIATGDVKKDFETLVKSRDVKPIVKEFKPNIRLRPSMKIIDYYKKEDYFSKEIAKIEHQ